MKNNQHPPRVQEKILLVLLPYWTPLIPPLGLACLKGFLTRHGYNVKTVDANTEEKLIEIYNRYFSTLKQFIPGAKQGNFYNIGNYVWQDHMMAHINHTDESEYIELVKDLVYQTFYVESSGECISRLNEIVGAFYTRLEDYFVQLLERENPAILGLSVYSGNLPASLFAFRLTRERHPGIKTVMGGGIFSEPLAPGSPNLEFFLEKTRSYLDAVIIGEGELLFLKYLRGELPVEQRVYTINDINGEVLDISTNSSLEFSDFDLKNYPHVGAYTSRSCPYQCKFCSEVIQWGAFRKKKAAQVVEELSQLYHKHRTQLVLMGDSLLNHIVSDLARELEKSSISMYWDGYLRADRQGCDVENTLLWRRGGFYRARMGLESGSARILELMGKKITVAQIKAAVSSLAYAGIKTTTYWVIGYPGETEEDFMQTLRLIEELTDDIYEADCNPFAYFLTGQVNSHQWAETRNSRLLFPPKARDMLMVQTWIMEGEPSREEIYQRVNRFVQHCRELNIPNPYSLHDIYEADKRWTKLHKNAVPPIMDFLAPGETGKYIDENKKIKNMCIAQNLLNDEDEFGF